MSDITEHPCIQHQRGEPCGKTWYSATVDGQTVGACARREDDGTLTPLGKKDLPLTVDVDRHKDQVTVTLLDAKRQPVTAIAFAPVEKKP